MELKNIEEVIEFAVQKEREAVDFYENCSGLARRPEMRKAFKDMADEERKHIEILKNHDRIEKAGRPFSKLTDLKISDYIVEIKFHDDMKYRELLMLAMKREEKAMKLYAHLAESAATENYSNLFANLAREELKHKRRLEREYDESIGEN